MMINISNESFAKLNEEQTRIIESKESKIVVSAGPGSGKTYTIVKKIMNNLNSLPNYRGVIACSFTKEASRQLLIKLEQNGDIKSTFVGTIDSFLLTEIFDPFKNRFLNHLGYITSIQKLDIMIPEIDSEVNRLTKNGIKTWNKHLLTDYSDRWLSNFHKGVYEISFPSYKFASKMIKEMSIVHEYIKNKYDAIYIDEAQDMNDFQFMFLNTLISICNLNCVLIGDKNQSIYSFRGSNPDLFYGLKDKGFKEYIISVSLRCHKSILDYSNLIVDPSHELVPNNIVRVSIDSSPDLEVLNKCNGNYMLLCDTNDMALNLFNNLNDKGLKLIYSQSLIDTINNKKFSDNYLDLVEEVVKFYLNYNNYTPSLTYSIENFKLFLSNFTLEKKLTDTLLSPSSKDIMSYVTHIFHTIGLIIPEDVSEDLNRSFSNVIYLNHYKLFEDVTRVMTIHSSKGLEADNIFVILKMIYSISDEYYRKLFVAFSRAKHNLHISYHLDSNIPGTELDKILRKNLDTITEKN